MKRFFTTHKITQKLRYDFKGEGAFGKIKIGCRSRRTFRGRKCDGSAGFAYLWTKHTDKIYENRFVERERHPRRGEKGLLRIFGRLRSRRIVFSGDQGRSGTGAAGPRKHAGVRTLRSFGPAQRVFRYGHSHPHFAVGSVLRPRPCRARHRRAGDHRGVPGLLSGQCLYAQFRSRAPPPGLSPAVGPGFLRFSQETRSRYWFAAI